MVPNGTARKSASEGERESAKSTSGFSGLECGLTGGGSFGRRKPRKASCSGENPGSKGPDSQKSKCTTTAAPMAGVFGSAPARLELPLSTELCNKGLFSSSRSATSLGRFRFPQPQNSPGWVLDDAKPARIGDFCHVFEDSCAQRFCVFGGAFDILDKYVR